MKWNSKKMTAAGIIILSLAAGVTGCAKNGRDGHAYTTVIAGETQFNGVFNPFFSTSAFDRHAYQYVFDNLIGYDREGQAVSGLADYKIEEIKAEDGTIESTEYTFTLPEGVKFSDGTPVTADDIIFNIKVYCDPAYDGASVLSTVPIKGLDDYKKGDAKEIAGLEKIDERTVKVTIDGIDPAAIYQFVFPLAPQHYYGADENGNQWTKGDLSLVKSKNDAPMGSGPYTFEGFANNIVTLRANEGYRLGAPKTPSIKLQVNANANKLEAVKQGDLDISDPAATPDMVKMAEDAGLYPVLLDNPGYGYIGINADRVPDINVRKGLMHLMNRKPAVATYFGDLATVIERPLSTTSWAYPKDAGEYYGFDPEKALEYFMAAGYEQKTAGSKTTLVKDGKQLVLEIAIGGDGTMNHPTAPVLTQMKTELEKMGAVLNITDCDTSVLFDKMNAGEWDMWTAAWSATPDPNLYQLYHSEGTTNHYRIKNEELDKLIEEGRSTNDTEERKEIYSQALDLIMDQAVEMPVYQRMNMIVFNDKVVNTESLAQNPTPYYQPFYDNSFEIHMMELK